MLHITEHPGHQPTVVLMHGVFMDHTLWDGVADQLKGRHILAIDMPGHGASGGMEQGETLDDHVASVARALSDRGVHHAVVAGHSWGGMVGVRLAERRPDLVAGLVLTNTPLVRATGRARIGFVLQRAIIALGFPLGAYAGAASKALYGPAHHDPATAARLTARLRKLGRRRIRRTITSVILDPADAVEALAALPIPLRVVGGEHDYAVAPAVRDRLARHGIGTTLAPGGHTGPEEHPLQIATAISAVTAVVEDAARKT
jgi:pimeloyl-ACP methyl ester carboxylesterase